MKTILCVSLLLGSTASAIEPPSSLDVARTLALKLDASAAFDGAKPSPGGIAAPAEKEPMPSTPEAFRGAFLKKKTKSGTSLRLPEIDAGPVVAVGCGLAGAAAGAIASSRNGDSRKDTLTWTGVGAVVGYMIVGRTISWFIEY